MADPVVSDPRARVRRRGELAARLEALHVPRGPLGADLLDTANSLADLLADTDNALEAGYRGGHGRLLQALTACLSRGDDDDAAVAADALAAAVAACTGALPSGRGFPMPPGPDSLYPPPPLALSFAGFLAAPPVDAPRLAAWMPPADAGIRRALAAGDPAMLAQELRVLVRPVPAAVHRQKGQDDVGVALWPAAPVLARWGLAHLDLFAGGPRVLEVGAGIGLTGAALGLHAAVGQAAAAGVEGNSTWVLTDFNPVVLENLRYNAALNDPRLNPASMPAAHALLAGAGSRREGGAQPAPLLAVLKHDWSVLVAREGGQSGGTSLEDARGNNGGGGAAPSPSAVAPSDATLHPGDVFDVVLGSDMICCTEDAHGVAATLAAHLRRPGDARGGPPDRFAAHGGVALVLVPPPFTRYGVDALPPALAARGLVATAATIDPVFTSATFPPSAAAGGGGGEGATSDASGIVVAGGRERELQLWVVHWPSPSHQT